MSRSNYNDDCDGWALIRWRGAVNKAIKEKRGQQLLTELLAVLDAMPVKRLIAHELEQNGEVCALGALGQHRHIDLSRVDPHEPEEVAEAFGVARALVQEIVYENDEGTDGVETPEARWTRMRTWVAAHVL